MTLNLFSASELAKLDAARRAIRPPWTVVYCVWENAYARSGGIGAVARDLPPALAAAGARVVVISPWHSRLKTAREGLAGRGAISVPFGGRDVTVQILEEKTGAVTRLYLDTPDYFTGDGGREGRDPYIYSQDPCATLDDCALLRDSLFACAAVPRVLAAAGLTSNLVVHAQDWQLASTALTVKLAILEGILESAVVAVTSHNPYDHQLSHEMLGLLTERTDPYRWQIDGKPLADSVYAHMLPLTDVPVSTVSRSFAAELTLDPLLTRHFTPHLQAIYRSRGVAGIPNGRFGQAPATQASKLDRRRAMFDKLARFQDDRAIGNLDPRVSDSAPVYFMFGRFDAGQKGFDVFARAIEAMPKGIGRYVLAPQARDPEAFPGDRPFLDDLAQLAKARPGEVIVFPFQMDGSVYASIMAGATYAVMPSFYEPFGAATEPYLAGTPVIARATGGLSDQVTDLVTGLVYRESTALDLDLAEQWNAIEKSPDPAARISVPLYASMVAALGAALGRAASIYAYAPGVYEGMLANLAAKAATFDWTVTAKMYLEWYGGARAGAAGA